MFDIQKFGAFVAKKRRDADMTQSCLAERLSLTRQAVSKYETGDSFPDISILTQIAEVFCLSLDELVGSGGPTAGESKILKNEPDESGEVRIGDVVNLAPLVRPSVLRQFAERLNAQHIDISHIVELVLYLSDENVSKLLEAAELDGLDERTLRKLAPCLNDASKDALIEKIIDGEADWRLLRGLGPYLENRWSIIEAAVVDGALPKEVLGMLRE